MIISGKCFCGEISVKGEINSSEIFACHCIDCQIFSGAPFRVVTKCKKSNFEITGLPKEFIKIGGSGKRRIQAFCHICGSHIYASDIEKTLFNIRVGLLNQRKILIPQKHIFSKCANDWIFGINNHDWD